MSWTCWQVWHVFDDGNQRSATTSCRPVPACFVCQVATRCSQCRVRQAPAPRPRTCQTFLPQHRGGVQAFNNDAAVSFGQPRCEDMQVMTADIVDPAMQPGQFGCAFAVPSGTLRTTRACPRHMPQLTQRCFQRAWVRPLDGSRHRRAVATVANRRTPTSTPTRESGRVTRGCTGRWSSTRTLASKTSAVAANRDREHPRTTSADQALDPASVLMDPDGPDHWQLSRACGRVRCASLRW